MHWVDQASIRPFRCALVPYVGNGQGHMFLDTGQELDLEHVYISDAGCELVAQALGWVPPQQLEDAWAQVQAAEARVLGLERELQDVEREAQAIDGLTRHGFVVRRAPGRKPKKKPEGVEA